MYEARGEVQITAKHMVCTRVQKYLYLILRGVLNNSIGKVCQRKFLFFREKNIVHCLFLIHIY